MEETKAKRASATFRVSGLHCADCAARLEKAISRLEGVESVTVGFGTASLNVVFNPNVLDLRDLGILAGRLGYSLVGLGLRARGHEDHAHEEHDHEGHDYENHDHEGHGREDHDHDASGHAGHSRDGVDLTGGHEHEHSPSAFPVAAGALGIAAGFVLDRLGVSWYWAVYLAAALIAGFPVARSGFSTLLAGAGADINLLTTVAGVGAMFLGEWAEAASALTLFSVGEYLEEKASEKARSSIGQLMDLAPSTARLKRGDEIIVVPAGQVLPGETVVVLPGDRVPVDGYVQVGESSVDEASITGESMPVDKRQGDMVYAGTMNGEGSLEVLSSRTAEDTTISRIAAMVENAQAKKAMSQRLVDSFAKYWTPAMMALSALVGLGVPLILRAPLRPWIYRGLTVLIVSCPCSLVISTPVTVVAAIARAARNGVLVKGGIHLEELGKVKAVAFDKTGTITRGRVVVSDVIPVTDVPEDEVLRMAASVEARSEHPLARAILDAAEHRRVPAGAGEHFVSIKGKGAKARLDGRNVYVGNSLFMEEAGIQVAEEMVKAAGNARSSGQTVVYVGSGNTLAGLIAISDEVRPEAATALESIRKMGLRVTMLTGDEEATARSVAGKVGLDSFKAGLLPEQKQAALASLRQDHGTVAMVGDGVNDAPSLASADVGIAMGQGADVALETADVALLTNDVGKVAWSIGLGRKSRSLIVQNVGFSVALKILAIGLTLFGALPLWLAVLTDSGAAVAVTFNGMRVLAHK
ncbi:MAG: heavy metal translocating P-type ATPase [Bacillota bacterium]